MDYTIISKNGIVLQKFIESAMAAAAETFGVEVKDFLRETRKREVVDARRSLVANMMTMFRRSISQERYGAIVGKDHATAIHYARTAEMEDKNFQISHAQLYNKMTWIAANLMKGGDVLLNVCMFLQEMYPQVIYMTDHNINLSERVSHHSYIFMRNPRLGYPSIIIFEPRQESHGLFIEIETLVSTSPSQVQDIALTHQVLQSRGYKVLFVSGYQECIDNIKEYLGHEA